MKYKNSLDNHFGNPLNQLNNLAAYAAELEWRLKAGKIAPKGDFSDCCGAPPYINIETGMCSDCKEHCEFIYE